MADIGTVLQARDGKAQYDQYAKEIISYKPILANILVHTVKEFIGKDPKDIVNLIEDDIKIGETPVDPGFTNWKDEEGNNRIAGRNTESNVPNEGVRYFDVLFYVRNLEGLSKIIINIEIQKNDPVIYDVEMRGIYYAAREISSQLDRDFVKNHYNDINKVYSIWICMNDNENSIGKIHLTQDKILGDSRWKEMYDVLNVVIIRIKKELDKDTNHKLHRLLGALFINTLSLEEKKDILSRECNISITKERREALEAMCNLGEGILEQGIAQGVELGEEKEKSRGIRAMYNGLTKIGVSTDQALNSICEEYHITLNEVKKYLEILE